MTPHVRWRKGGEASLLRLEGESVAFRSTIPSPPGSRIDGDLLATDPMPAAGLRIKVHASKRQADGSFVLEGRLIDATRELRERLAALLAA